MDTTQQEKARTLFRTYQFVVFFGFGALFPLLGVYLKEHAHLSGGQIGAITSIGPIVMLVAQPLWGILCDYTQRPRHMLLVALLLTAAMGTIYAAVEQYALFLLIAVLLAVGQSAITPISDSITLSFVQRHGGSYGGIRLYGALGFAAAGLLAGKATDWFGMKVIFYIFAATLLVAAVLAMLLPKEGGAMRVNIREGARHLLKKREFVIFLFCTFLIFGPINANNTYFGLLITQLGGTLTGVGFAFLLAAGSEAPFMRFAAVCIERLGMTRVLVLSSLLAALRWLVYYFEPPLFFVYATTLAQGASVGLFIPAALQYVRGLAPASMQVTAVSLYAAAGGGLGTWFCTFFGGRLMDRAGIGSVYLFFAALTLGGVLLFLAQAVHTMKKGRTLQKESA